MRVWSLHPTYLDQQGLCGLWRETLLCQRVLAGGTKGYTKHPQLARWRACAQPLVAIGMYLSNVCLEGQNRGYNFNSSLILYPHTSVSLSPLPPALSLPLPPPPLPSSSPLASTTSITSTSTTMTTTTTTTVAADALGPLLEVTAGQLHYEMEHLRAKLQKRDKDRWAMCKDLDLANIQPHPCFAVVEGEVAEWEKNVTTTTTMTTTKKTKTAMVKGRKGERRSKRVKTAAEEEEEEEEEGGKGELVFMSLVEEMTTTTTTTIMGEDDSSSSGKRKTRGAAKAEWGVAAAAPVIGTPQRVRASRH